MYTQAADVAKTVAVMNAAVKFGKRLVSKDYFSNPK